LGGDKKVNILECLILGIVQGLTEFLPVSSSGHLVLFQKIFGIEEGALTFDVALHLATLIAVFAVFWKDIISVITKPFSRLTLLLVVGTIPTMAMGFLLKDFFEKTFESGATLGVEFLFTGLILWYTESVKSKGKGVEKTTYADAALIGVAQGIAILPAVSRSGLTIAGALFRGLDRDFAAKFSFLMSIPVILGAGLLDGYKVMKDTGLSGLDGGPYIIGMLAAAVSGYFAIKIMLKILAKGSLRKFSYYVFAVGGLVILDQLFFKVFF
jgi:undecaprenyl-diphosphatase